MRRYQYLQAITLALLATICVLNPKTTCANEVQFSISLEKQSFYPREWIVVEFGLRNISDEPMVLIRPSVVGFSVNMTFSGPSDDPSKVIETYSSQDLTGWGTPTWIPGTIRLESGQIAMGSCDLSRHIAKASHLPTGKYKLQATYHFQNWGSQNYATDTVESNSVHFEILQPVAEEKVPFAEIERALAEPDSAKRLALLNEFLEKRADSPFRLSALKEYSDIQWYQKDYEGMIDTYRQLLSENVGRDYRERLQHAAAITLVNELGRLGDAIAILEGAKMPPAVTLRNQLIQKWNEKNPHLAVATSPPPKDDAALKSADETVSSKAHTTSSGESRIRDPHSNDKELSDTKPVAGAERTDGRPWLKITLGAVAALSLLGLVFVLVRYYQTEAALKRKKVEG